MSEQKTEQKKEKTETLRFLGEKGGETECGQYITMGAYMGNLWSYAIQGSPNWLRNSMLRVNFASYHIPHELMQVFFDAEFENQEDGLHASFTFKDAETRDKVIEIMKAQKALDTLMEDFLGTKGAYTNQHYTEWQLMKQQIRETMENHWYFLERLADPTTNITYMYDDGPYSMEKDDIRWILDSFLEIYELADGTETIRGEEE